MSKSNTQPMMSENTQASLRRTPLFQCHKNLGARFTEFGGWEMPVQYTGVVDEHLAVRTSVGIFDVSHMGEFRVQGKNSLPFLQFVTSNDVSKLTPGRAQYSLLTNQSGGVVDDIIVYMLAENDYFICVNAANIKKDFDWMSSKNTFSAELRNASDEYAQLAIQGPRAMELIRGIFAEARFSDKEFRSFSVVELPLSVAGKTLGKCLVARTGYSGEDGVEIFCEPRAAEPLWNEILKFGKSYGIKPIGLGARDTLRLEACYPLYGHELGDSISAISSGVGWVVKFDKGDFIGRDALKKDKEQGVTQKLVGLEVKDPGIIREGAEIFSMDGKRIGWVTSGTKPPTVQKAVAMAIVSEPFTKLGSELFAEVRGRRLKVEVIGLPFYKRNY